MSEEYNKISKGTYSRELAKIPSSKRWIYYDNLSIICNYLVAKHNTIRTLATAAHIVNKLKMSNENLLDASDRVLKLVRNNDKSTLKLFGVKVNH